MRVLFRVFERLRLASLAMMGFCRGKEVRGI